MINNYSEMSETKKIQNLNIPGENNDMIDSFEDYVDHIDFSDELKIIIRSEISKLRSEIKNKEINWTINEQEELKKLLDNIIINENIEDKEKIKLLVNIMKRKIKNELDELDKNNFKNPQELAIEVELNTNICNYGDITDKYIGNSNYLIFIFPVIHRNKENKDIFGIDEKSLSKLVEQNNNILGIVLELIREGICTVYSFEGLEMIEVSKGLPIGLKPEYFDYIEKYEELLEKSNKTPEDNRKIIKMEKAISYIGLYLLYPEIRFEDNILSYGIDVENNVKIGADLSEFIVYCSKIPEYNIESKNQKFFIDQSFIEKIEVFLKNKKLSLIEKGYNLSEIKEYLDILRNILIPKDIIGKRYGEYSVYITKKLYYYRYKKRNEDVVENLQVLYKNTTPNGIILRFGLDHFSDFKTGIREIDEEIIPSLNIKDIKTLLRENGISYLEITPHLEKKEDL